MEVKPSAELLRAISSLPVNSVPARAKVSPPEGGPRSIAAQAPAPSKAAPGPGYRPGTFLDIYV